MLIAISGWKKSGKDSFANILCNNYKFKKISFAEPLKDMVSKTYDLPRSWMDDQKMKEMPLLQFPVEPRDRFSEDIKSMLLGEFRNAEGQQTSNYYKPLYWTPRALLILEGSVKRSVTPNFWVTQALSKVSGDSIITDLRYKSEAEQIKKWGNDTGTEVVLVRINRFETSPSTDPSERDLDNYEGFDIIVRNKGSYEDLVAKAHDVYHFLKYK